MSHLGDRLVVVTDLDGTLLDHSTYSFAPALPALRRLKREAVPVVFCSSKTAAEIRRIQKEVGIEDPFIFENGGGIWLPQGFRGKDEILALGVPVSKLETELREIARQQHLEVRSMLDMSDDELARVTGLSLEEARMARVREFSIPFLPISSGIDTEALQKEAQRRGLKVTTGGRFFHLMGPCDKGDATRRVREVFKDLWHTPVRMVGLGDSRNDLEMLRAVDISIRIPNPDSRQPLKDELDWTLVAEAPGPCGWNGALFKVLDNT